MPAGFAPQPSSPVREDLVRGVVADGVRAARARAGEPEAESVAAEIGRRIGRALAREASAPDLVRALGGVDGKADRVLDAAAEGLVEGFTGTRSRGEAELDAGGAAAAAPPSAQSLVAAARQTAHDLNQPLTVILGYAAILKRAGTEALRVEAAEHIIKEARKMSGIVAGLSRLARRLDAA